MAPEPRPAPATPPVDARRAAGLLLLYPRDGRLHLLLTLRGRDLPQHRGQVSLPGGLVEPGESIAAAALREAHEEVGLDPDVVRVLGGLSPLYIPVSGFLLHPIVGVSASRPAFLPRRGEVERVIELPLDHLVDPRRQGRETRMLLGEERRIRYFDADGEKLWGATAMVLSEFLAVVEGSDLW
jgi:8-oxo-dGTP pyrophosphatase MutT (NUDIX family)